MTRTNRTRSLGSLSDFITSGGSDYNFNNGDVAFTDLTQRRKSKSEENREYRTTHKTSKGNLKNKEAYHRKHG
jgi:hypothetical protein